MISSTRRCSHPHKPSGRTPRPSSIDSSTASPKESTDGHTIDTFLDAMFAPYPSTPRLLEAKGELRAMMEDAYADAVGRGKTI